MEQFEKFLTLFFSQVSQLYFDKSRELVEREREQTRTGQIRQFISILPNFIEAERSYYNLGFLSVKNKIFLRKDNTLKSMYESIKTELNRLEDGNWSDRPLSAIISQLSQYLTARVQLVELYEKMYSMGTSNKPVKYEELKSHIEVVIEMHTSSFPHAVLASAKAAIICECEVLRNLIGAQIEMQKWNFITSLMHLHAAHSQLNSWEKSLQGKESWKLGFGAGFLKGSQLPGLYHWLVKLKCGIVSKFSLYFYHTLAQQSSHQEMRNHLANKHVTDYYHKLQNLQRRVMASVVVMVFESVGLSRDWGGPTYLHPESEKQPPEQDFIVMISHPVKTIEQLPRITQILSERAPDHVFAERVLCFYGMKENCTYFMNSIDPRVTLVVVFESKKDDKEITVVNHMNEFCAQVRCTKVFASLKVSK